MDNNSIIFLCCVAFIIISFAFGYRPSGVRRLTPEEGHVCPDCKSNKIWAYLKNVALTNGQFHCTCDNCGHKWIESD